MSKKLLIYQSAVPVSAARHGAMSYEPGDTYSFTADINAVPLMAVELLLAATEYAIVFATIGDEVLPAAVLGVKPDQNLYLTPDAHWQAKYIPAFIRRYPFVFATSEDRTTLTLCIDEAHPGLNSEGRGQRLFTDDGKPSPYTEQVLKFLKDYQVHFNRTKLFGRHLKEHGLLEPVQAQVTTPKGEKVSLGGFSAVSRAKLRALSKDALAALVATDELELIYLHLYSLRNFQDVKERFFGSMADKADVAAP